MDNNISLKQKIDFILNYLYDNFGTAKSELKKIQQNNNLYLFDIYFDGHKLRFDFLFCNICNIDDAFLNDKIIVLNTGIEELKQLPITYSFNFQIIDNYTLNILINKNQIVQLILSIREEQENIKNIWYNESEIEFIYELIIELISMQDNIQNF